MQYRVFGRTGLEVSTVSMGCNRLGDPGVAETQWPPLIERALELGVNLFDTSNSYNQGRSEAILGEVTKRAPFQALIATKVGVPVETNDFPNRQFSARTILREVEDSLRRIQRDAIDLYMLHSPTVEQLATGDWRVAIERLEEQGKVRFFGVSTDDHRSGIEAIRRGADFLQVDYSILDPSAEDELLPFAREHNVGIMIRMPLARGLLSGKFATGQAIPPGQQWRRPRGKQLQLRLSRVEQLRFLERPGQNLAQAAIRWTLCHPAVHCAIPGARTVSQLESNCAAVDGELSAEERDIIARLQQSWRATGRW